MKKIPDNTILDILEEDSPSKEYSEFEAWLNDSKEHKEDFDSFRDTYLQISSLKKENNPEKFKPNMSQAWEIIHAKTIKKRRRSIRFHYLSHVAAVIILCLTAGAILFPHRKTLEDTTCVVSVPKGESRELCLPDGTHVRMKPESELHYPATFNGDKRIVSLSGEAYFEVKKDKSHPFLVKTEQIVVEVLGTSFNVSSYTENDITSVTLVEGLVRICNEKGENTLLTPSQCLEYNKSEGNTNIRTVNTQLYTAWINGKMYFENETLNNILTELKHWYSFDVACTDSTLLKRHFSFEVTNGGTLSEILEIINYTSDLHCEIENNIIHIQIKKGGY